MIKVSNITKKYKNHVAVDDLSFQLGKGEVVGFLGPNGAGKTTTMRILTGYLPPTSGSCEIGGYDVSSQSLKIKKLIGYLPESNPLYIDMEVCEYLTYVAKLRHLTHLKDALDEVIHTCCLREVLGRKISELSKGFKQRVGLAQALIHKPEILILDEPTVGLDPNQIGDIRDLIKNIGKDRTVLLSSHILSEIEQTCQRVIIINKGKIVGQGTPQNLIQTSQDISLYRVGVKAELKAIENMLTNLQGANKISHVHTEENIHYFKVESQGSTDLRESIFKNIAQNNWSLLELVREKQSLENVFKELTK